MTPVGKAAAAKRLAAAAAYGGGGLSVLGAGLYGVLRAEAQLARARIGEARAEPPRDATGWYGRGRPGPALKLVMLGDSGAAGYGVERVEDTPGAIIAASVSEQAGRRVYLKSLAVVGAESTHLAAQVDRALPIEPDVAIINIGVNDITHRVSLAESIRHLSEAVRRLRAAGVAVVVGTCADIGTVQPISPPLRQVARRLSRRLAAAQAIAVVEAGGRTVSLGDLLGPEFAAQPHVLFGPDRFHPSEQGYASMAGVLLPSVLAALGLVPEDETEPQARRGEGVLPIARAAVEAARTPGTELGGTEVEGARRGVRGLWVELRHRRRRPQSEPEGPEESELPDRGLLVD